MPDPRWKEWLKVRATSKAALRERSQGSGSPGSVRGPCRTPSVPGPAPLLRPVPWHGSGVPGRQGHRLHLQSAGRGATPGRPALLLWVLLVLGCLDNGSEGETSGTRSLEQPATVPGPPAASPLWKARPCPCPLVWVSGSRHAASSVEGVGAPLEGLSRGSSPQGASAITGS